jgi:hypothetical protein
MQEISTTNSDQIINMTSGNLAEGDLFSPELARSLSESTLHRREYADSCWPGSDLYIKGSQAAQYFKYVNDYLPEHRRHRDQFIIQRYGDLFEMIAFMRTHQSSTKEEMLMELKATKYSTSPDDENGKIIRAMELAVHLWLGISVEWTGGDIWIGWYGVTDMNWKLDETLSVLTRSCFSVRTTHSGHVPLDIPLNLTAANLQKRFRVQICFTNSLADHLRLCTCWNGSRRLFIYQHGDLVDYHHKFGSPFPPGLLNEVSHSLHLLLPVGDMPTKNLCKDLGNERMAGYLPLQRNMPFEAAHLDQFDYLKRRMATLVDLFHSPPEKFTQRLLDARYWYRWTLPICMIVIMICILAFVVMISVLTLKANDIAQNSYDLSVIQACQGNSTSSKLLRLCN